jgi:dephospho-CoA kinase
MHRRPPPPPEPPDPPEGATPTGRFVGLTGGIASGKSTAAAAFAQQGIPVIDTDRIARELVEPGQPCLEALVAQFGTGILDDDGRLDRSGMRRRMLADPDVRRQLEAIMHPAIRDETRAQAAVAAARAPYVLVVVPLLAEPAVWPAYRDWLDEVIVLTAPPEARFQRLVARPGIDADQARALMDAQVDDQTRLAIASRRLCNDRDREALARAVRALDRQLRRP